MSETIFILMMSARMLISLFYYQEDYVYVQSLALNTGTSQRDVIRMLEAMQLAPQVEYLPARSVDAKKIILNNERIMSIHAVPLVPVEQGIRKYYQWLKKGDLGVLRIKKTDRIFSQK